MTCYFNALLQAILVVPVVWQAISSRHAGRIPDVGRCVDGVECPACVFEKMAWEVTPQRPRGGNGHPQLVYDALPCLLAMQPIMPNFVIGVQHDASELFLSAIRNVVHTCQDGFGQPCGVFCTQAADGAHSSHWMIQVDQAVSRGRG